MSNIDLLIASKFKNPPLGAALLGLDGLEAAFSRAIADIYPTVTVSGNPISFSDGAKNQPVESCVVSFSPIQDTSNGDPSPDNICPITGWSSVGVTRAGVNLFDKATAENGFIEGSSGNVINNSSFRHSDYIRVFEEQTYTISGSGWTSTNAGAFYDTDKNYISGFSPSSLPNTFTPPANACYMRLSFEPAYVDTAQLELGSTATTYAAPSITPITADFADTYYSGTIDLVSGVGSVTHGMVDLGTLNWANAWGGFATYDLTDAMYTSERVAMNMICSNYSNVSYNNKADKTIYGCDPNGQGNYNFVAVQDSDYTDAASFKSAMSGVMLCYELAEPISFSVNPQTSLTTLGGDNVFFTDADNLEVTYRQDA